MFHRIMNRLKEKACEKKEMLQIVVLRKFNLMHDFLFVYRMYKSLRMLTAPPIENMFIAGRWQYINHSPIQLIGPLFILFCLVNAMLYCIVCLHHTVALLSTQ